MTSPRRPCVFCLAATISSISVFAATTLNAPDFNRLATAIANDSMVHLAFDGSIGFPGPISISKKVTIDASGRDVTFSGNNNRIFRVSDGGDLTVMNVTFRNGRAPKTSEIIRGGAIQLTNASLSLIKCNLIGNHADVSRQDRLPRSGLGGALSAQNSVVFLKDCLLEDNLASGLATLHGPGGIIIPGGSGSGGAMYFNASTVEIRGCTFRSNKTKIDQEAGGGGGAIQGSGFFEISDCDFIANTAGAGGALLLSGTGGVSRCHFSSNSVAGYFNGSLEGLGGAVHQGGGLLHVNHSTFVGNSATGSHPELLADVRSLPRQGKAELSTQSSS